MVAFACKGRGFCPSCTGRRMCATAANLIEHVLPRVALRQWVRTFPFRWRRRLAQDGELLGHLSRIFVSTVAAFYGGKTGAMTVVQRTSSDLRLNPHLHVVFLDGSYASQTGTTPEDELVWREHGHLQTREVGAVLAKTLRRMHRWLRRRGALQPRMTRATAMTPRTTLRPRRSPARRRPVRSGLRSLDRTALAFDKPLCASLDGFTLHAATRAGAMDDAGREALA